MLIIVIVEIGLFFNVHVNSNHCKLSNRKLTHN